MTGHGNWLVVVAGPMASGKSTVAQALARALHATLLTADEVRQLHADRGVDEALAPGFSSRLYPELFARARGLLHGGQPVVMDGTFRSRALRAEARATAHSQGAGFLLVECRPGLDVCRRRAREREAAGEPGWTEMLEAFLREWEPVDELSPEEHRVVDSSQEDGPHRALEAIADGIDLPDLP